MDLLKHSLVSATPLTDLVIKNSRTSSSKHRVNSLSSHVEKEAISSNSKKMTLKISLDKKTNKLLFAQATGEFVEFLFSFLTLPLGGVEYLSGGKTRLDNIDNLYRSVTGVINDEYFKTREAKSRLMNPKQPHGSVSENQFLPLCEQRPPPVIQHKLLRWSSSWCEAYVKKQKSFIVSDDLTVTPFSIAHSISIVNGLGVPLSDVRETELQIGQEEVSFYMLGLFCLCKTIFNLQTHSDHIQNAVTVAPNDNKNS